MYKEKTILLVQYSAIAKVISTMISENKTIACFHDELPVTFSGFIYSHKFGNSFLFGLLLCISLAF